MLLSLALSFALAAPDAGAPSGEEEEEDAPTWRAFGEGDGGLDAPPLFSSKKLSTALTVHQKSGSGGTMHFAESTTITCAKCTTPLRLTNDALIDHVLALGEQRYLLLGWASGGSGRQSLHVLLVHVGASGPRVIDELTWSTSRSESGVLLASTPQGWRIGIPQPITGDEEYEQDYGTRLSFKGLAQRRGTDLLKSGFFKPVPTGVSAWGYVPPFPHGIRARGNVGWLRATATGFALENQKTR